MTVKNALINEFSLLKTLMLAIIYFFARIILLIYVFLHDMLPSRKYQILFKLILDEWVLKANFGLTSLNFQFTQQLKSLLKNSFNKSTNWY